MPRKSDVESMSELTSLMWSRYLKEQVRGELNHEMNAYKAEVVTNHGDGTITVQRPFEAVTLRLKASPSLKFAQAGDMVIVVGVGDKSKALSNAFILCKADVQDTRSLAEEEEIAIIETGANATHTYTVGDYFCMNGLLYRVSADIAVGQTFTVGTNCILTDVGTELSYRGRGLNSVTSATLTRVRASVVDSNLVSIWGRSQPQNYNLVGIWMSNKFITLNSVGGFAISSISTSVLTISIPSAAGNIGVSADGAPLSSIVGTA